MNLKEKAMLVKFSRTAWSARKYDKKITEEVDQAHGSHDAGRYNKILMAKEALKAGQKTSNEARTFVYTQTLPWTDEGWRILPSANYLPFTQEIRKKITAIEEADRNFIDRYPEFQEEAKGKLNSLYNELDYPPIHEIARKFSTSIQFNPIPDCEDFRVSPDIPHEDMATIGGDLDLRVKEATANAVKDLWQRLFDAVSHCADTLGNPDTIFRDSLIKNIVDLCDLLPRLNLTNDPDLEKMRREVESKLTDFEPEQLRPKNAKNRTDERFRSRNREQTADEAKAILKSMEAYFTPTTN